MTNAERTFIHDVWEYYRRHGRRSLPWRKTKDPYRIMVSEIMLQQTQVDRVVPKYEAFLKRFPTVHALAEASLSDVLRLWQGLGYNRRAKMLHQCAVIIVGEYHGKFPRNHNELMRLPGIGHYTAGAIMAFAYGSGVPIIETNIRSVYLHHFFNDATDVTDVEILEKVTRTLDTENAREWYYALMDYGVYIKKEFGNPNSRSKHYTRQSTFKGSDREIRGAIIKVLSKSSVTYDTLHKVLPFEDVRIDAQLDKLTKEGLISCNRKTYALSE